MTGGVRRFYDDVAVVTMEGGFAIALDGRPVKSPNRRDIRLPRQALAARLAAEWAAQSETIDQAKMPMMRFVAFVTDRVALDPDAMRAEIVDYAGSDLLCYRAEHPTPLIERQSRLWNPVLERLKREWDVGLAVVAGIMPVTQDPAALGRLAACIDAFDGYRLGALHQVTTLTGSAVLALALAAGWLSADEAWTLAHLDEDFQTELWGADAEAEARRQYHRAAFDAAVLALSED